MKPVKEKVQVWIGCTVESKTYFLLLKTTASRGAFWQPVTGGVDAGESLENASLREALEETQLKLEKAFPLDIDFSFNGKWGFAHETCFYTFLAKNFSTFPKVKIDNSEHISHLWCEAEKIESFLKFDIHRAAYSKLKSKFKKEHSKP